MTNWLTYFSQVSICLAISYGLFWFFFKSTTFHGLNRLVLLIVLALSFLIPYLDISVPKAIPMDQLYIWDDNPNEELVSSSDSTPVAGQKEWGLESVLVLIHLLGMTIMFFRFLSQFTFIIRKRFEASEYDYGQDELLVIDSKRTPFSFFSWIFVSRNQMEGKDFQLIIAHEKAHVALKHSIDLFIYEICKLILWFNPVVYFLGRSLKSVHEFQADERVLRANRHASIDYVNLLLSVCEPHYRNALYSNFHQPIIKTRINMLSIKASKKLMKYRYLMFLVVFGVLLQSFAFNGSQDQYIPDISPIHDDNVKFLSSGFGKRRDPITREEKFHHGIDLAAKSGTPVRATASGTVVAIEFKEPGKGHGRRLIIQHDHVYSTSYSQLSAFEVERGQMVSKGDVIGYVGSSGRSTGPHLHYEIRKEGKLVDPTTFYSYEKRPTK